MSRISRTTRRMSKANAAVAKQTGAGSPKTGTQQTSASFLSRLGSAAVGFISGGPAGAIAGAVTDPLGKATGGGRAPAPPLPSAGQGFAPGQGFTGFTGPGPCPPGRIRVESSCVDLTALPPGGTPAVVPQSGTVATAGGGAVMGGFGMPAMAPTVVTRLHRICGPGMVLGKDNLCYPKAVLSRRSRFRKWRQPPRPPVTSSDVKAIRRAARARDRVSALAQDVGFKKPKRK